MTRDHWIIAACLASYIPGWFVMRRIQQDNAARGGEAGSFDTFGFWLMTPVVLPLYAIIWVGSKIPPLLFPVPQVKKVRDRLTQSAAKEEQQ